jgi:hypothetical protein|tara:strand:- start:416 stop:862 length:447 start_codon:yes stop_codon:yes gene_type:complete
MKSKVIVRAHKETGAIVTMKTIVDKESGEERQVGTVMVEQTTVTGLSKIARIAKRVAFITLEEEVVDLLSPMLVDGGEFPVEGKLVVTETTVPYLKKDGTPQEPKRHGGTNEVMMFKGTPIYRNTDFSEIMSTQDTLLVNVLEEDAVE